MSQKNIDFGSYPDDPDADAIRTAFQKTQQNFSEIFAGLSDTGVQSVNKTKQPGITVSAPTGNVLISADFACLTIQSTTLSLTVSNGSPATTQVISNSSQVLQINVPSTANLTNANLSGNLSVNGWANIGNAISNVIINSGNIAVTGNVSANNFTGANLVSANFVAGNLTTAAQPNITSVGTLTGLGVNGNITAANITANTGVFTGNGSGLSALPGANVTGTVANANYAAFAGVVTTNAQSNITSVGTLTSLSVTGNVSAGNANLGNLVAANFFSGDGSLLSNVVGIAGPYIVNGTSYSNIIASGGNIVTAVSGVTKLNVYSSGIEVTGLANVSGNISAGNADLGNLAIANFFSGNANSLSNIPGANVTGTVANATHASTANTIVDAAQPNITSVGTLTSLSVTGNISAGNISTTGSLSVTGNANVGNIGGTNGIFTNVSGNGSQLSSITGANVTGQVGNALVAGTVYTAAQPNITSVGTLTSLSVTGNTTSGNMYANSGTIGASLLTGTLTTNAQPNITSVGTLSSLAVSGNLSAGNANLGNLATANFFQGDGSLLTNISVAAGTYISNGTSNVAVTSSGGNVKIDVGGVSNIVVVTSTGANITGTLNVTGNANVGNIGATRVVGDLEGTILTNSQTNITTVGTLTGLVVNGVSNLGPNGNVIITGGASGAFLKTNGSGNLSWDTATLVPAQGSNTQVIFNDGGSTYAGNANLTFDKTNATFTVGNSVIAGNVYANSGTVRGSLLTGTLTTASQPNITSLGTLSSLIVSGNINAGNISGNGFGLSSSNGANISGQVANALVAGTVYTAAQPNITSVGTLTSLSVTGNITSGNANLGNAVVANYFIGNFYGTANSATTAGTVTTNAQPNITSVGALSSLTVSGNINAGNITVGSGTITANVFSGNATSLSNIPGANVTGAVSFATTANAVAGANVTGAVSFATTANAVAGANVTGAVSFATTANAVAGANVTGQVGNALVAGTVYTAAQPNITSVGTLTSLAVTGNVTAGNFVGTYANGNSNISIPAANGNINFAVAGRANGAVLFTDSSTVTMIVGNQYPQTSNQNAHFTKIGKDIQLYRGNVLVLDATAAGTAPNSYVDIYAKGTLYVNASPLGSETALEVNGNVVTRDLTARNIFSGAANGTTQATASTINSDIVNVTSVTLTNRGVVLPDGVVGNSGTTYWGFTITIRNSDSANNLYVYPGFSGGTINGGANNAAYQQAPGTVITYICFSSANSTTGNWYTNGATYA